MMRSTTLTRALRTVPITYAALRAALEKKAAGDRTSRSAVQRGRNATSALNAWLAFVDRSPNDAVGSELDEQFDARLSEFLEHEKVRGMSLLTLRDRRRWVIVARDTALRLRQEGLPDTFAGCLLALIQASSLTLEAIAAQAGLGAQTLRAWIRGKCMPGHRVQCIHALEAALGAAPRTLFARLPAAARRKAAASTRAPQRRTSYGERIRRLKLSRERYGLSHVSASLRAEWRALLEYKSTDDPALERSPKGIWRIRARADMRYRRPEWVWGLDAERVVPSAAIFWQYVKPFLGWLTLKREKGGLGLPIADAQTLAWLTQADLIARYLAWRAKRAGGYNGGSVTMIVSICALIHPKGGFIAQQPQLGKALPSTYRVNPRTWRRHCGRVRSELSNLRRKLSVQVVKTRDPWEPLQSLIGLRDCLRPIVDAVRAMRKELPGHTSPLQRAQAIRDILIIELFMANPLRVNQWSLVRYREDDSAHLYRSDGAWRVRFVPKDFKNEDGAAGDGPYDVQLPRRAWSAIEHYLKEARSVLLRGCESDYFIVGGIHPGAGPWSEIDAVIRRVCKRFLALGPSIGPAAFRKLVTTFWLKKSGRNYVAAARLLNDRIRTVVADYAHLETEHAFEDYSGALDAAFGE